MKRIFYFVLFFSMFVCTFKSAYADENVIVLTPQNSISLRSAVFDESVSRLIDQIMRFPGNEFYFYIDSHGGSVIDGLRLIDAMRASGKKIKCIANTAASMAFSILQACDVRLVMDNSIVMQHEGAYSIRGQVPNNLSMTEFLKRLFSKLNTGDAKRIGLSYKEFKEKIRDDWWLLGSEAVEEHVADKTALVRCSKEMAEKREYEKYYLPFATVEVVMSGCPLADAPLEFRVEPNMHMSLSEVEPLVNDFIQQFTPRRYLLNRYKHEDRR